MPYPLPASHHKAYRLDLCTSTVPPAFPPCALYGQRELVDALVASRVIVSQRVVDAMLAVDRREFINPQVVDLAAAYQDRPQYNGEVCGLVKDMGVGVLGTLWCHGCGGRERFEKGCVRKVGWRMQAWDSWEVYQGRVSEWVRWWAGAGRRVGRMRGCKRCRAVGPCTAHSAGVVFVHCVGRLMPCKPALLSPRRTPLVRLKHPHTFLLPDSLPPVPDPMFPPTHTFHLRVKPSALPTCTPCAWSTLHSTWCQGRGCWTWAAAAAT